MAKWDEQLTFEEVKVGDELPELALPLTVQRLVMEAAANRDFVPLHSVMPRLRGRERRPCSPTRGTTLALSERHLREWVGLEARFSRSGRSAWANSLVRALTCIAVRALWRKGRKTERTSSSLIFGKTTAPIKTCGAKRWSPCLQSNRNQGKGTIQLCRIQ